MLKRFISSLVLVGCAVSLAWAVGVIFNDTMTGTNGTALSAHTPDTGTSWTSLALSGTTITLNGSGGATDPNGPGVSLVAYYKANATYDTANYDVEAQHSTFVNTTAGRMVGLLAHVQDASNFYLAYISTPTDTNDVRIYKCVGGTLTKMSTTEDTGPVANDIFILEVRNNSVGLKKNGSYVINPIAGDAALAAAGTAGYGVGDVCGDTSFASGGANFVVDYFKVTTYATSTRRAQAPILLQ